MLYKYRSFRDPFHFNILEGEIWFASPTSFNDPFDCNIPYRFDLCPEDWLQNYLAEAVLSFDSTLSLKEAHDRASALPRDIEGWSRATRELLGLKNGVFSLTPFWNTPGSQLMWAHYADSHRGFAVGFKQKELLEWMRKTSGVPDCVKQYPPSPGLSIRPTQVTYCKEMPKLKLCEMAEPERDSMMIQLTHKYSVWSYEQEVRYLLSKFDGKMNALNLEKDDRLQQIPKETIGEVILGSKANSADIEKCKLLLRNNDLNISLYQIKPQLEEFKLTRAPLSF